MILLEVIRSLNFLIFSSSLNFLGIAFSIIFCVYIPSILCLLINLANISFIFSSKPEIAFGIFFGLSTFAGLFKFFLDTFFKTVFFVFFIIFALDTWEDLEIDFFLVKFFFYRSFLFSYLCFLLYCFFFLFCHNFILILLHCCED